MSTLKVVNFVHGFLITVSTLGYEEKSISRLPKNIMLKNVLTVENENWGFLQFFIKCRKCCIHIHKFEYDIALKILGE